jgi:hypothetical protein
MEHSEGNTAVSTATPTPEAVTPTPTPTTETTSYEGGGDVSEKLGLIPIMMLGLTTASLVYSIYYYRNSLREIKKGSALSKVKADVDALRDRLDSLVSKKSKKTRNGSFA